MQYFEECFRTFACILPVRSVFSSLSSMLVSCTSQVEVCFCCVVHFAFGQDFCEAHFLQDGRAIIQNAGNDFSVERP